VTAMARYPWWNRFTRTAAITLASCSNVVCLGLLLNLSESEVLLAPVHAAPAPRVVAGHSGGSGAAQEVSQLYVALFGRAPDIVGLNYWVGRRNSGQTMAQVADSMYGVTPARAYFPAGLGPRDVVASFYRNVLGREADSGGLDYWANKLATQGATPGAIITEIIGVVANYTGGVPEGVKSAQHFSNRVSVAAYYAQANGTAGASATIAISGVDDRQSTVTASMAMIASGRIDHLQPFSLTPRLLPDLKSKYEKLCGAKVNVQNAIALDMNKDGRTDLMFNLWCGVVHGSRYAGPVPNSLVVFTQNEDGSWTDATANIFGSAVADIGGVGIRAVVSDLNADGYPDVVFAVNWEDGRSSIDDANSNQKARNAVVLSQGNGGYAIFNFGQIAWNYGILLRDNEAGQQDVISVPFGPPEAFRFSNGMVSLPGYEWVSGSDTLFFRQSGGATKALAPAGHPKIGLDLWIAVNGNWSRTDSSSLGQIRFVNWISWQRNRGTNRLLTMDGTTYISPSISSTCELRLYPSARPLGLVIFSGLLIDQQRYEQSGDFSNDIYDESGGYLNSVVKIIGYDTADNKLSRVALSIAGIKTNVSDYRLACRDINNDGFEDILITDWRSNTKPIIYLNDRTGGFVAVTDNQYPVAKQGYEVNMIADLDGDGIPDLLHWPIAGAPDFPNVRYQIFKGTRHIDSRDIR